MKVYAITSVPKNTKDDTGTGFLPLSIGTFYPSIINGNINYENSCYLNPWLFMCALVSPKFFRDSMLQFIASFASSSLISKKCSVYATKEEALAQMLPSNEFKSLLYVLDIENNAELDARITFYQDTSQSQLYKSIKINIDEICERDHDGMLHVCFEVSSNITLPKIKSDLINQCRILDHYIRYYDNGDNQRLNIAKFLNSIEQHEIVAASYLDGTSSGTQHYNECLLLLTQTVDLMIQRLGLNATGNPESKSNIDDKSFHDRTQQLVSEFRKVQTYASCSIETLAYTMLAIACVSPVLYGVSVLSPIAAIGFGLGAYCLSGTFFDKASREEPSLRTIPEMVNIAEYYGPRSVS